MRTLPTLFRRLAPALALPAALWLAACTSPGPGALINRPVPGQFSRSVADPNAATRPTPRPSGAANARDYRRDAAHHVYAINASRIYRGMLPPLLYAVGTLQVQLDANGRVTGMHWLRAPTQAPDAIAGIERIVLTASPFPAATRLGPVVWTDTWLWDESGRFQLDTLSEGQLQE